MWLASMRMRTTTKTTTTTTATAKLKEKVDKKGRLKKGEKKDLGLFLWGRLFLSPNEDDYRIHQKQN